VKCEMLNQNESMRQSSLFKELLQESAKGHVPWVAWHAINSIKITWGYTPFLDTQIRQGRIFERFMSSFETC